MSRYIINGNAPELRLVVGWDRPLQTYFTQVWDGGEIGERELLLWTGCESREVGSVAELVQQVAPFAEIPAGILDALRSDGEQPAEHARFEWLPKQ